MSNDAAEQRTRLKRWKHQLEQKPISAAVMLLFGMVVAIAGAWKILTGDRLWESINAVITDSETLEECIDSANDAEVEILKCKEKFGVRL